jgi:ADP-heptose:LPS heptosyltransferase
VLHPGSGDNFPGRRWPVERFAAVAARLHARHGGSLFVTGGVGERPLATELTAELAAQGIAARDLSGALDLPELLALLSASDLLLSNDTGPVHLANALRRPVVALFGPNSPRLYGPLGANQRALYHPPPCSPCLTNQNAKSSGCTLPICILRIAVDEVAEAADELLAARPAERAVVT